MFARRLTVAALLPVVLAACGGTEEPEALCDMVDPATVAAELRSVGAELRGSLRQRGDESPGLSVCSYRGGDTSVRVSRDTAPQAPLRYFHRIVEQFEFHAGDPQREPHLVFGVGDDRRAHGGAGSYLHVKLSRGRIEPEEWAARGSRPPAGERPPRGTRLVLLVAERRLDRASGTACAGEQ